MKKYVGLLIILVCFPTLFVLGLGTKDEVDRSSALAKQIDDEIQIEPFTYSIPVRMTDKNGVTFAEEYVEWRTPLTLDEIPTFMQELFIQSEDALFFEHRGYDVAAIARAFLINASTEEKQQGASTITQQLVRMRFLTTDKTYERKITELFYAQELEQQLTKKEILTLYLNEMYFGNQVYGVGAAATYFFQKDLRDLSHAEIAFLAAIPNNPSLYNPTKNFDGTKERQLRLLDTAEKTTILTPEQVQLAKQEPITLSIKTKENQSSMYSDFVLLELESLIAEKEGFAAARKKAKTPEEVASIKKELQVRTQQVISQGLLIETAFDKKKQDQQQEQLDTLLRTHGIQGGAVVINNATREISAVYSGLDYKKADFNRAFQAVRQPGSIIKPLLVYGPLLQEKGFGVQTPINNAPLCIGSYCPKNIGGFVYGSVPLLQTFRHSHNTGAVRTLRNVGIENAFHYLTPFQFEHIVPSDYNYPAALGGFKHGMTPYEMANAYSSFIDGQYSKTHAIRNVKNTSGEILYTWDLPKQTIWSPSTVKNLRILLQDVAINGTGKGVTYRTSYTGVKTGTTNHYHDLWAAGLTDTYTTALWLGLDTPSSIEGASKRKIQLQGFSILTQ